MLRDYEDENGNVVLYFDDVSPYTPTKKHKIELDPVMREEFSRSVRQIVHASSHYKYERNIAVRKEYEKIGKKAIRRWIESGKMTPTVIAELKENEDKWNIHHFFPIVLGGTNNPDNLYLMPRKLHDRLHHYFLDEILKTVRKPMYLKLHDAGQLFLELPHPKNHILEEKDIPFCSPTYIRSALSRYSLLNTKPIKTDSVSGLHYMTNQAVSRFVNKLKDKPNALLNLAFSAIHWCKLDLLAVLLDKKRNYGITPESCRVDTGETLLMEACLCNNAAMVRFLLEQGAYPNQRDKLGQTALHKIFKTTDLTITQLLIKAGADVNAEDVTGQTPLWFVGQYFFKPKILFLLENGTDINHRDKVGNTVFYSVIKANKLRMMRVLLQSGIDLKLPNKVGLTACDYARNSTFPIVRDVFCEYAQNPEMSNDDLAQLLRLTQPQKIINGNGQTLLPMMINDDLQKIRS